MKTKKLGLLFLATFLITSLTFAQAGNQKREGNQKNPDRKMMMMKKRQAMQKVENRSFFNEEQKETMKKLRVENAKKLKPLKNELNELNAHQKTLTTAANADLKAIYKNIEKISAVKTEMAKIMAAQHQETRALLTEEQLLKFDSMKARAGKGKRGDFKRQGKQRGGQAKFKRGA